MKNIIAFIILLMFCAVAYAIVSDNSPSTEAQNRAGIKQGHNCYCDYNTGWCEGLKISNNQSSC